MNKIAIIGDLHIGKGTSIGKQGLGGGLNSRVTDQLLILNFVLEKCIKEDIYTLIFTGDIFDTARPDYRLLNLFIKFLRDCVSNSITCHIVAGNHDLKRVGNNYYSVLDIITSAGLEDVTVYKTTKTVSSGNFGITLVPYQDRGYLECETNTEALEKLSNLLSYHHNIIPSTYIKVLVGHLAIEGSIYFGGEYDDVSSELMCPISMFDKYDQTIMGHIHTPQTFGKKVEHIGSMDISDFGEAGQKKSLIILNEDGTKKYVSLPTRSLKHIDVDVVKDKDPTKYVINKIKKIGIDKKSIIRLQINLPDDKVDNVDRSKIEKVIYDLGAFNICNFSESRKVTVVPNDKIDDSLSSISLKDAIKLYAEQSEDLSNDEDKERYIELCNSIIDDYVS